MQALSGHEAQRQQSSASNRVCSKGKYNRHPEKQAIARTLVSTYVGEILHVDIFSTDGKYFLAAMFSKFASVQPISSRRFIDIKTPLL